MTGQHDSTQRRLNHREGQLKIRRLCKCGRTIIGNAGWHSHLAARGKRCSNYDTYFPTRP